MPHLKMRLLSVFSIFMLAGIANAIVEPILVAGNTYVHDPTMCKDNNGMYFLFSTAPGIGIRTSTDRSAWTFAGLVWPNGASWTDQYTGTSNGNLWAPACYYSNGVFLLYYAASSFGSQNSAIFLAKSTTGLPGSWSDEGLVTSTKIGDSYNAIDPHLLVDGSQWYLSLGSFWTGIKSLRINPATGKPLNSNVTSLARRTAAGRAIESSAVYKNDTFYYLFTSWDKCCDGTSSTYNIRVGRSSSPQGGFVDQYGVALTSGGGTPVLSTHDRIFGPGGQDLMTDSDGPILVYHYYTSSGSFLGVNRLDFSSGWPVVI